MFQKVTVQKEVRALDLSALVDKADYFLYNGGTVDKEELTGALDRLFGVRPTGETEISKQGISWLVRFKLNGPRESYMKQLGKYKGVGVEVLLSSIRGRLGQLGIGSKEIDKTLAEIQADLGLV